MATEEIVVKSDVKETELPMEKKVIRKKRKYVKRIGRKKPGPKPGTTQKRKTRKKVAKVAKRGPGRPPKKRGPGRPTKKAAVRRVATKKTTTLTLPVNSQTDVDYWINMVGFLNKNRGKSHVIVLDGKNFSLGTM